MKNSLVSVVNSTRPHSPDSAPALTTMPGIESMPDSDLHFAELFAQIIRGRRTIGKFADGCPPCEILLEAIEVGYPLGELLVTLPRAARESAVLEAGDDV